MKKSCVHQLSLVISHIIYDGFFTSQVVGLGMSEPSTLAGKSMEHLKKRQFLPSNPAWKDASNSGRCDLFFKKSLVLRSQTHKIHGNGTFTYTIPMDPMGKKQKKPEIREMIHFD